MGRYAENTSVTSDKSRAEIEATLRRYGATSFGYGWEAGRAVILFEAKDRRVKFILPMPDRQSKKYTHTPTRNEMRAPQAADAAYEQDVRQRWRALALCIKAKLEAVAAGITSFESEFLSHIVLPDGSTVGAWIAPQIEKAYAAKKMPPMLLAPEPKGETG